MKWKNLSLYAAVLVAFSACGGGSSDSGDSSSATSEVLTGTFIDAPVEGLGYKTASQEGVTDAQGHFSYKAGEDITFNIGEVSLGSVVAKKNITPLTLGGDKTISEMGVKSRNIARLLQSLDNNPEDSSKIVLAADLKNLKLSSVDLKDETSLENVLNEAAKITAKSYMLRSKEDAENEMEKGFQKYLYDGTYTATTSYDASKSRLPIGACANVLNWDVVISNGEVKGDSITDSIRATFGIAFAKGKMSGTANDGTKWDVTIDEDGHIEGTYDYMNGSCVGRVTGSKK